MVYELLTEGHAAPLTSAIVVYGILVLPAALLTALSLFMFGAHTIAARRLRGDPSRPPDRSPGSRWLRHRQRMGVWLVGAGIMAGTLAVVQLGIFAPYHLRMALGTTIIAQVHHKSSFDTKVGGGGRSAPIYQTHWTLKATTDEHPPRELEDLVEFGGAQNVEPGDQVSAVTVPWPDAFCQYGSRPTAGQIGMLIGGGIELLAFVFLLGMVRPRRSTTP